MDNFCIAPFVNFSTTTKGHPRLCCQATEWKHIDIGNLNVDDIWSNEVYKQARDKFLNNEWPTECDSCKNLEKNNITSRRYLENERWKHLDWEELKKNPSIYCYDLRMGNACNLKCVMCNPYNSNQWADEFQEHEHLKYQQQTSGNKWAIDGKLLDDIKNNLKKVQLLYFSGGEPLLIKKHKEIIDLCVSTGLSENIELIYDTNGTYITEEWISKWNKFKKVRINFSIDGGKEVNEYIRYPIKHDELPIIFELLSNSNLNIFLQIALGAHNIFEIEELEKYKSQYNFKGINMSIVNWPNFMSIDNLSNTVKQEVIKLYFNYPNTKLNQIAKNIRMNNNFPIELQKYFTKLDKSRNLNHTNIFTWLYE